MDVIAATDARASAEELDQADADLNGDDNDPKGKSSRWQIGSSALSVLEQVYTMEPFPGLETRRELSKKLNVSVRQVQVWFQNKRQRERKISRAKGLYSTPGLPDTPQASLAKAAAAAGLTPDSLCPSSVETSVRDPSSRDGSERDPSCREPTKLDGAAGTDSLPDGNGSSCGANAAAPGVDEASLPDGCVLRRQASSQSDTARAAAARGRAWQPDEPAALAQQQQQQHQNQQQQQQQPQQPPRTQGVKQKAETQFGSVSRKALLAGIPMCRAASVDDHSSGGERLPPALAHP